MLRRRILRSTRRTDERHHIRHYIGLLPAVNKPHTSPMFRDMHVHHSLRRPHPVVLFGFRNFSILAIDDFMTPFDTREIYTPFIARSWRRGFMSELRQSFPRKRNLD